MITTVFNKYKWLEWKFVQVRVVFWRDKNNHKKYLQWLGKELNYTNMEDWYKINYKDFINNYGTGLLSNYYKNSPILILKTLFNQYEWLEWKFKYISKKFWKNKNNQKKYLQWVGKELKYKNIEDWYKTNYKDIINNYGKGLLNYYKNSQIKLLKNVFNKYKWLEWKFAQVPKNFWNKHNQKRYLLWLGKELNYANMEDWYKTNYKDFINNYGAGLLNYYNNSHIQLIVENFTEYTWIPKKFKKHGYSKISLEWLKYKSIIDNTFIISRNNSLKEYEIKYNKI